MIPIPVLGKRWRVSDLFKRRQGAWLEPRIGYMWQENTGATPTTSGGQTIGKLADVRGDLVGSELVAINNDFSQGSTNWNVQDPGRWVFSNGKAKHTPGGTLGPYYSTSTTAGGTYRVTFTLADVVAGNAQISFGGSLATTARSASGTYTQDIVISSFNGNIVIGCSSDFDGAFDIVSVKPVILASQATTANRPTLQYVNGLPLVRCDSNKFMTVNLPNLGGGVFSSSGSVYFGVPQGMSALHNQSIGTNYTLPAVNSEIYGWVVVPERLTRPEEAQLERYFLKRAGISGGPDYLLDNNDQQLTDDSDELLLRA